MIKISNFNRTLTTIGLKNFVNYFEEYRLMFLKKDEITQEEKYKLAAKMLNENANAESLKAQITRINAAIRIFDNGWESLALEKAANSRQPSITLEIRQKAKALLLSGFEEDEGAKSGRKAYIEY